MNLKLKNLKLICENVFKADIILDNELIGLTYNKGDGSATQYQLKNKSYETKLNSYCDTLPKEKVYFNDSDFFEIKMSIEKLMDSLVQEHQCKK